METISPAIILVEPQLGENIGAAARAMLNCSLTDLRLVNPRDFWPNDRARAMASGADSVLEAARLYDSVGDAVADLQVVFATTARHRDMVKLELTPQTAAAEMRQRVADGQRCGILFGRERIGLTNDEVALSDGIVHVPLNPDFSSLNLAQAVLLMAWEWTRSGDETEPRVLVEAGHEPATKKQMLAFFDHLELALETGDYFKVKEMRPVLVRSIRNIFTRSNLTDQEVRTLHGIVTALVGRRKDQL